jgi:predicted transposase YbfD/YdcC
MSASCAAAAPPSGEPEPLRPVAPSFLEQLAMLPDPRLDRTKRHRLVDIVAITILGVLCGADTFTELAQFGRAREAWLRTFLELPNGIPSHDTFARVLARLEATAFADCLTAWARTVATLAGGDVVAIDGKTVRRAHRPGERALHTVSAWATAHQLTLGQLQVDEKSNEITAIPALLDVLTLEGTTVTIDAIGCQREITTAIRAKQADYVLVVKKNQPWLHERLEAAFARLDAPSRQHVPREQTTTLTKNHGRLERRTYTVVAAAAMLTDREGWADLQSVGRVVAERRRSTNGELISSETRYFITSLPPQAEPIAHAIRAHWAIENCCHWVLDVVFQEDQHRARTQHAASNLAVVRRWALSLLRQDHTHPHGIKARRLQAAWDQDYLLKLLRLTAPAPEAI